MLRIQRVSLRAVGTLAAVGALCGCQAAHRSAGDVQYRSPLVTVAHVSASTRAHRRAAIRDAKRLLAGVVAPSGAVLKSSSSGIAPHTLLLVGALNSAVERKSWTVPEDSSTVLSYVTAHLPAGSKNEGTGSGGPPPMQSVDREWAPVPGVLGVRWLRVQVTSIGTNETLLSATAQSQWIVDRSASQRIAPGVRQINVTSQVPGKRPFLSKTITSRRQVQGLVKLFNSLPLTQRTETSCPMELTDQPVVTITFTHAPGARPLARASASSAANLRWPASSGAWVCFATQLSLRNGQQASLSGNVIGPLQRLLGVNLAKPAA
jgi:hypothetical protein